ncbi:hypothetical protein DFP73DRAFT_140460 [Morchella snyderi]|nr:hypothetical protein DFP73DRAFT_140460 [Morchella snyderi]
MTRITNLTLPTKRLTIAPPHIAYQLPRAVHPPPTPYPWVWRCHRCHADRRFTASNRCLGCSHVFCTRCVSEYDYSGWEKWGAYYRRRCSTNEGTEEVNATGDRSNYKRDNPEDEDQEDDDEEISSLDAFEFVVPSTPTISHTQLDSDSESSESEDEDKERYALTPPGSLSITHNSHEDNEENGDDDEEEDFQWILSPSRPYSPTTAQADDIPSPYTQGEECERLNTNENGWDTVPLSPKQPTFITGYSSVEEARNALYTNGEEGEVMRGWSGCFSPISAKGSETAMCGDEDDWEQPLWSPVLLTCDGFF